MFVHTPETAAPIKRAGTSIIEMGSSETVLRTSVVVSPHRWRGQRRYSKCVSAKQSARIFLAILAYSNPCLRNVRDQFLKRYFRLERATDKLA